MLITLMNVDKADSQTSCMEDSTYVVLKTDPNSKQSLHSNYSNLYKTITLCRTRYVKINFSGPSLKSFQVKISPRITQLKAWKGHFGA